MLANVYVTLKPGVLDPQGEAVKRSLVMMGNDNINQVRVGKFIQVWLQGDDIDNAKAQLKTLSEQLLANPVIEDFRIEIAEGE